MANKHGNGNGGGGSHSARLNRDEEHCLRLGQEVVRMLGGLLQQSRAADGTAEAGYAVRTFTYPGGEFYMLLLNDRGLAEYIAWAVERRYDVADVTVTPQSQKN